MSSRMHRLDSPRTGEFFERLAAAARACLMLDYDGTLAPFTPEREHAAPYPGVVDLLKRIARQERTSLAIVSGRAVRQVRKLLGWGRGIEFWGSHGAERLHADGSYESYRLTDRQAGGVSGAMSVLTALVPPEQIERKPFSVALHWRGIHESIHSAWAAQIRSPWEEIAERSSLGVHSFNGGIEIRPVDATKAIAVQRILLEAGEQCLPAYLGDDLTDEDAFQALPGHGLGVLVGDEPRPSNATLFLRRPDEVLEFLQRWCGDRG